MSLKNSLSKLFKQDSDNFWVQLLRYSLSGTSATIVDFLLLTILTEVFGEHLLLVWTAIAFISGVLVTYLLSTNWVFDAHRFKHRSTEIVIFIFIALVGLTLTELLMWLFAHKIDIHYLLSKLIASIIVFVWNFTAKKYILFHE